MFEHEHEEASPIEVTATQARAPEPSAAAQEGDVKLDVKWGQSEAANVGADKSAAFKSFLTGSEKVLFHGPTWKRKGNKRCGWLFSYNAKAM